MNEVKPLYLLAGGNRRGFKSMIGTLSDALKSCAPKPRVAYVGTASGDNLMFYTAMKGLLLESGAGEVVFPRLADPGADTAAAKAMLESADAVFLSGGEVDDGMNALRHHGLVDYLRGLRERGTLFLGVSAGSIMMGAHWVSWRNPDDDNTAELFDCLGFVPTTFDTHAEDEDWKELKTALRLLGPGASGYGIPMDGALRYDASGGLSTLGKAPLRFENRDGLIVRADS